MAKRRLSAADKTFCALMLLPGMTQSDAWRRVHPDSEANDKSVWELASTFAARPEIKDYITSLQNEVIAVRGIATAQEAWLTISAIMRCDPRKLYDENGKLKAVKDIDNETVTGIISFKEDEIKLASKLEAAKTILQQHANTPPPPDSGELYEEPTSAYDMARRIAFALELGQREKQLKSTAPTS